MTERDLDYLGGLFIKHDVLDKKGITFIQFIELWKQDKHEEVLV